MARAARMTKQRPRRRVWRQGRARLLTRDGAASGVRAARRAAHRARCTVAASARGRRRAARSRAPRARRRLRRSSAKLSLPR
eukprot:2722027-Pleurochrysis_carterae.AAC.1